MAAAETQALFQQLTILLALAATSHFLFRRWRLPMIIGEIAVGIVLGPSVVGNAALGSYRYVFDPAVIRTLAVLGSIFLLFLIGLDFDFRVVYTRKNVAVASGGVVLPLLLGFATALYLVPVASIGANGTQFTMALFVGATLTATSVAITAAVLFELNLLKDRVAQTILGAAVVDDVLGLIVLSVVVRTTAGRVSPVDLVILVTEAVGLLVVGLAIGIYVLRRVVARIHIEGNMLGVPHGGFLVAIAITFLFALTAESLGLSAVVGAFLAGSVFANTTLQDDFSKAARPLAAVFTPIFFVSLGLQVDFPAVAPQFGLIPFSIALTIVAVIPKVVGCSLPARLAKMTVREAVAIGWGMTPRGEVGLVVAFAALSAGGGGDAPFFMIVLGLILGTVLPAPLFRRAPKGVEAGRLAARRGPPLPETETRPG